MISVSQSDREFVFRHYGKKYNKEISDVLEAYTTSFDLSGPGIHLPTKDECRKKIEYLQTITKKLKTFAKKNRYTDEEIKNINDDMHCLLQGCTPNWVLKQHKPTK